MNAFLPLSLLALLLAAAGAQERWNAPDRGEKVAALIPGRNLPALTPDTLFADWTAAQGARWAAEHPDWDPAEALAQYAAAEPTDASLVADFPRHIAPFGRVRSGEADAFAREEVLIRYCPFCGSRSLSFAFDPANEYHATTTCCRTELWGREADMPADDALRPNATVSFLHLDDTTVEVPCTVYRDAQGTEWELFIKTLFEQRRWLRVGSEAVKDWSKRFAETADPLWVHKIAVVLDEVAETYYGLPLAYKNELAKGRDGEPLTRAEWEAVPRPAIFEVSYLGGWNRRTPIFNKGWINMSDEHVWVEPFARVRHHPAFKAYSQAKYGDPDALDARIREKLLREIAMMFKSVFSQKLLTNYQEANYVHLWLLGVLLGDETLLDFAGPAQEVAMYNHTYQDGLNGEGAPNYMAMPGGYFYPFLAGPWLEYDPTFLDDHPFYPAAAGEMRKLHTVRGMPLEFGDQHLYAWPPLANDEQKRANERLGSRNWAGYGVGLLRVGGPGRRMELCLDYTRATLHNARDALSLDCWVDGVPVMRRGGYAAGGSAAQLQWERPEHQALRELGYPRPIDSATRDFGGWAWVYVHSMLAQNGVTVDDTQTGGGWGDNRGYGEVLCFKGGEPEGAPGAGFQVLDVRDHDSWDRVDKDVDTFRRTLIGVAGPDGRPYVLDLLKLTGGRVHTLYNSAWAERADDALPAVADTAEHLEAALFDAPFADDSAEAKTYRQVRDVERLAGPADGFDLTWRTDLAAYAPRELDGGFQRPLPAGDGQVRLRMIGLDPGDGELSLLRGKGPWIARIRQPLPGGGRVDGNVAFRDAIDFLIERHEASADGPLTSLFAHILEGRREGEPSAIERVERLDAASLAGEARDIVAVRLALAAGHSDTIVYQSAPGAVRLPDGTETDARYALLRRAADGSVIAADAVAGTRLTTEGFAAELPGAFTGEIVDVIGDLTGTRRESALIVRPDRPWPDGAGLHDRQLLVRYESELRAPGNEGWRIDRVTALPNGLVRVDVQDHAPFAVSWHQVTELPADRPNTLRTWRPMVDHGNNPWYHGLKAWFPERGRTYPIARVNEVGGGYGGDTLELLGDVDLAADGIAVGDWYLICGIEPGVRVSVANDLSWRVDTVADGDGGWRQAALRATGPATVVTPLTAGAFAWRADTGGWQTAGGKATFTDDDTRGGAVTLIAGQPAWLALDDDAPPEVAEATLDGVPVASDDLGWIDPPRALRVVFRDAANPLAADRLRATLNGEPLPAAQVTLAPADDGRMLAVSVDLAAALAPFAGQPQRHTLALAVADRSVARHGAEWTLSFINQVAVDPNALWLSDLPATRSFAHGGLIRDRDYTGNPATIAGRVYPKAITLCPEPSAEGAHGEAVYALPAEHRTKTLRAEVGVSDSSRGNGSVTFRVDTAPAPDGPWTTRFTSPLLRGGAEPVAVEVPLAGAACLRLWTGDAGDGINSDHAVWGGARLE